MRFTAYSVAFLMVAAALGWWVLVIACSPAPSPPAKEAQKIEGQTGKNDVTKIEQPPANSGPKPAAVSSLQNPLPLHAVTRLGNAPIFRIVYCGSPDGRFYVTSDGGFPTGGKRYPLRLWDAKTGKSLLQIEGNYIDVMSAAFCPDGSILATGGADGALRLWDTATGKQIADYPHKIHVYSVAWSPDGKFIATGSVDVKLWDVKQGKLVHDFQRPPPKPNQYEYFMHVALSPDGKMVAAQSQVRFRVWEIASGEQRLAIEKKDVSRFGDLRLERVFAFSADSKKLLATFGDERQLQAWDLTTGQALVDPALQGVVGPQAISLDGKWLAWNDYGAIRVRDLVMGKDVCALPPPPQSSFAFAGDAKHLLVSGWHADLKEYDVATGKLTKAFVEEFQPIIGLTRVPVGKVMAITQQQEAAISDQNAPRELQLRTWELTSAKELTRSTFLLPAKERPVQLSADGKWLLTSVPDYAYRVWDLAQAKPVAHVSAMVDGVGHCQWLQFSIDGKQLVGLAVDLNWKTFHVVVWDAASGKVTHRMKVSGGALAACFTADFKHVVTAPFYFPHEAKLDGKLRIWDVNTNKVMTEIALPLDAVELPGFGWQNGKVVAIHRMVPSPDGKWLAVLEEVQTAKTKERHQFISLPRWYVKIVNLATGQENAVLPAGQPEQEGPGWRPILPKHMLVPPIAWSQDSKWVATGPHGNVAACGVTTWTIKVSNQGHMGRVTALCWQDNGHLLSGGSDGTMIVWDPAKAP